MGKKEAIFVIYIYEIQDFAKNYIGRELDESELFSVKKCLESGLLTDITTVYKSAIKNSIEM